MKINPFWLRVMGICGILGGLLLFTGDMLFYYDANNTNLNLNMGNASDNRIIASGITALLSTWLYMIGLGQVYFAFKPTKDLIRNIVLFSFGGILIAFGIVHSAYVAIAATAKLSIEYKIDMASATALALKTNNMLRLLVYPIFGLLSFLFITQVWKRKTLYPRWIILFFPLIPFLFQGIVSKVLSGSLWVIVIGGYLNLLLVVFFLASTIALWNKANNT
jgi:hypothetical protein